MIKQLSVFFPAFNEERNLFATVTRAKAVLNKSFDDWEVIIVNDGSTDGTAGEIKKLEALDERIKSVTHDFNRGYGATIRSGIYNCQYDWIVFTDSDGQFDFSEVANFIEVQGKTGADLIIGYYLKRSVPFYRKINTFAWQVVVNLLFNLHVRDIDCGFKLFSKRLVESIPVLESERGAFVSTEFLVKAKKAGFMITEVGVHHYPRKAGRGTGSNLNVIIRSFVDLIKLWKKLL
jgi:glycosyltransferase involved in cell wall biosynthesis